MNILTEGAPKIWYCVHSKVNTYYKDGYHYYYLKYFWGISRCNIFQDSWKVLELARRLFPTIADDFCENFWRHKCFVMTPGLMRENGIEVVRIVQHPGEAIITLPGAFHCGFNAGVNAAAAINFAAPGYGMENS